MNFALILFLLSVVTGIAWVIDKLVMRPRRVAAANASLAAFDQRMQRERSGSDAGISAERVALKERLEAQPAWVEYTASFFPVLLAVFVLRSFVAEPFKIPSSSMRPTLEVGDFILVNKFAYGIRLPIVERKILATGGPQHGDVVVFRYPGDTSVDYIKRVVGLPGDVVEYNDKRLTVNGKPLPQAEDGTYGWLEGLRFEETRKFRETADAAGLPKTYTIAQNTMAPAVRVSGVRDFPGRDNCEYNERGFKCKVPAGNYFMMGDNRDYSDDSRYWGFVPDANLRGRAFFIWFNWDDIVNATFRRVGHGIQ
ncbi:MAG: signal peptidase I [Betaproteobacteria bacterium]